MPVWPCFNYPADLPAGVTSRRVTQSASRRAGSKPGYPCFSYPKICFDYPDDAVPGTGSRNAVQPPPDSKLCFSYTVTHCFRY
jgi:hypothetical protein